MHIHFEPFSEKHFQLIHEWFNFSHVQEFYSLRFWTYEEVVIKMTPYITGEKKVSAFIAYIDNVPIASIQKCKILEHPWPDMELPNEIVLNAAGLDFFIGPSMYLRKGLGSKIVQHFLKQEIWPFFDYCIVDPDIRNEASCQFFKKLGFKTHKIIQMKDALEKNVDLKLMILKK
jgi:aminoglycoside 6'-N-acetyltransferase